MSSGELLEDSRNKGKARDPLVGTVLDGRFQIDDVLGSGGMSVVYLATQIRVNRQVAIKTLKLQLDAKQIYRDRFHREINLLCALNHPHIVTVYDCIFDDEQQPYVVMDYLRGRSLEALIKEEGPLDIDRFARISVQVCSALDYAHKNSVIHRDLKPGNLVLMDDEMDFVKVVDFGLAKLNEESRKLTQSGELWGSPPYLSPEQCIGKPEDARSDIYSFGCVMYEMLTGKDPFHNGTTIYELIQLHVNTPPPSMRSVNPMLNLPDELERVIFKAMAKDPKDRYQTAGELSTALVKACAESATRESGNLKLMAGLTSSQEQPNAVSMRMVGNNFNLALDPMAGMSVEDAFIDRGRKATENNNAPEKSPPAYQGARERFSNLDEVAEPKKSDAGKMMIIGFIVVVLCAVGLFAAVSMRNGQTGTASIQKNAPTESASPPDSASKTSGTSSNTTSENSSSQKTLDSAATGKQAHTGTSESASTNQKEMSKASPPPKAQPSVTKMRTPSRVRPTAVVKRAAPKPAPAAGAKKHDAWTDLKGLYSR
ncbi:MAG TPA: serine/threonine-protein kinase [Candidatus Melainabacteria bacterium]|nr:serine/threonine-protein kinase [Candidatus Melainabacteria bacterium]